MPETPKLSALAAALKILEQVPIPLHYEELTKRILARGLWHADGKTPAATIARLRGWPSNATCLTPLARLPKADCTRSATSSHRAASRSSSCRLRPTTPEPTHIANSAIFCAASATPTCPLSPSPTRAGSGITATKPNSKLISPAWAAYRVRPRI